MKLGISNGYIDPLMNGITVRHINTIKMLLTGIFCILYDITVRIRMTPNSMTWRNSNSGMERAIGLRQLNGVSSEYNERIDIDYSVIVETNMGREIALVITMTTIVNRMANRGKMLKAGHSKVEIVGSLTVKPSSF